MNDHLLNQLAGFIHGEIKYLSSFGKKIDLSSAYERYDGLFLGMSNEGTSSILSVQSLFYLFENIGIGNEVNTLQLMFQGEDRKKQIELNLTPVEEPPFKIQKIKIFGQERAVTWDEAKKTSYFNQKVHRDIGDYYFNNTILRFESSDDRYINFFAEREAIGLSFQKVLGIEHDFYRVDQLFMGIEYITAAIYTNVPRIKCHYEIDEKGIAKYIKEVL